MSQRPTFRPDYGIEHHVERRARAGYWLVKGIAILSTAFIVVWSMS